MKFEENTAVTILRPKTMTIVKTWTSSHVLWDGGKVRRFAAGKSVGYFLGLHDEGVYWARGHEDEVGKALIVARALR